MTASPAQVIIAQEHSGIAAIAALVGVVLDVVDRGVDSDGDSYVVVTDGRRPQVVYDDQCTIISVGPTSTDPANPAATRRGHS